jgi:uncharacterized protein YjiS (DUF1127 family)
MATTDTLSFALDDSASPNFLGDLQHAWRTFARRRKERRTVVKLSRHGPHLLRDLGLDPDAVYGALDGTWDEVEHDRFPKV